MQIVCEDTGKPARTVYEVVETSNGRTRVHFYPLTVRLWLIVAFCQAIVFPTPYRSSPPSLTHARTSCAHHAAPQGRTHQLRVHAAHASGLDCPIAGDDIYGSREDRLYLHAEYLEVAHPATGERLSFFAPAPF